ncbi:hypothetical protein EZV62_011206 [Acer yangbiense]|uniref:Uncharacterized protein n=1 Tax=Acer yangbiense TaxID=1000413 RepID=A0A5C7I6M5_9ROSI|nr:hypothetical protein EZV62_011206 [Acer yangbiense]
MVSSDQSSSASCHCLFYNSLRVEFYARDDLYKLGTNEDGVVNSKEVEKCIEEIIIGAKSEEYKKNAMELKMIAREAVTGGGLSDRNIQLFVDEIIGN